jgi:hypothetical protein
MQLYQWIEGGARTWQSSRAAGTHSEKVGLPVCDAHLMRKNNRDGIAFASREPEENVKVQNTVCAKSRTFLPAGIAVLSPDRKKTLFLQSNDNPRISCCAT